MSQLGHSWPMDFEYRMAASGGEADIEHGPFGVIQAPVLGPSMRYACADTECRLIGLTLRWKPRGLPRADNRRALDGIVWVPRSGAP